ncbi:MAG TPA: hypothetical protein VNJ71_13885 [Gemmatimonadales bacterium]|nr:hypothetical protein [Gemmatimonadales bacterium]
MRLARPLLVVLLFAGCARALYAAYVSTSPRAPDDVYGCVQEQLRKLRFSRTQYDTGDRWIVAQRIDSTGQVSSGLYRRTVDVIEARARPDASGNTTIELKVRTFDEFATTRGLTQEERPASAAAKREAQQLALACSQVT